MNQPYAAIFDMDGVLIDSYHAHYKSWLSITEPVGLQFSEEDFAGTFGRTSREIVALLWGEDPLDDEQIAKLDARKEAAFREVIAADFPAMPGASRLLRTLHEAHFRLAVGSSGPPENVELVLQRLQAKELFDAVVHATDVTRGKPDPQVFLIAAERLAVAPRRCVVIEDAPAGIDAARAAGMSCVGLTSTGRTVASLSSADLVVGSLAELSPQLLRELIDRAA